MISILSLSVTFLCILTGEIKTFIIIIRSSSSSSSSSSNSSSIRAIVSEVPLMYIHT